MNKKKRTWRDFLPEGTAKVIKNTLELQISERQINRIIKAGKPDRHGVVLQAIEIAARWKAAEARKNKLTTKTKHK